MITWDDVFFDSTEDDELGAQFDMFEAGPGAGVFFRVGWVSDVEESVIVDFHSEENLTALIDRLTEMRTIAFPK